jgi:hypothetical protein
MYLSEDEERVINLRKCTRCILAIIRIQRIYRKYLWKRNASLKERCRKVIYANWKYYDYDYENTPKDILEYLNVSVSFECKFRTLEELNIN